MSNVGDTVMNLGSSLDGSPDGGTRKEEHPPFPAIERPVAPRPAWVAQCPSTAGSEDASPALTDDDSVSNHASSVDLDPRGDSSGPSPGGEKEGGTIDDGSDKSAGVVDGGLEYPKDWTDEKDAIVKAPFDYIASLPQKGFRKQLIDACNVWFNLDDDTVGVIGRVVGTLHNASLMIDDIQDGSKQRRGVPVAHSIYGAPQTINSANYAYFLAQQELFRLPCWPEALRVFNEELLNLHRGQGIELYWRDAAKSPEEADYLQMVSNKTGGLFRLLARLMQCASSIRLEIVPLIDTIGLIFQILDDYKNYLDTEMSVAKGYCEDLTEGKYSLAIIHALRHSEANSELENILRSRTEDNNVKAYVTRCLETKTGSFAYVRGVLRRLHTQANMQLDQMEVRNPKIQAVLSYLLQVQESLVYRESDHGGRVG
ncbi:MAG: hypothetical protein LQ344_007507 [Seirophora lacunosa]|nr:MAG: hypothetical protein LQ344_007507 [Seirophora lacunosa]